MFKFMKKNKVKKPNNGIKMNLDTINTDYRNLNENLISFTNNILIKTTKV